MFDPAWLYAVLLGMAPLPAAARPTSPSAADTPTVEEAGLLAAEDLRFKAELAHDVAGLDRMTASDVVYSHFNGSRESKAAMMQTFTHLPFASITPSDRYARVIADVGIVRGRVVRALPDRVLSDGYLAVYTRRSGHWQLLEWVSAAPVPSSSDKPPEPNRKPS